MMLSDVCLSVCLSVAYLGPKSRTERPRKTKIVTEVAHVARDSDTTFKVKRSKVKITGGGGILWRPPAQLVFTRICLILIEYVMGGNSFSCARFNCYLRVSCVRCGVVATVWTTTIDVNSTNLL